MKKTPVMYTAVTLLIMSAIIAGGCAGTTDPQETSAAGITRRVPALTYLDNSIGIIGWLISGQ